MVKLKVNSLASVMMDLFGRPKTEGVKLTVRTQYLTQTVNLKTI